MLGRTFKAAPLRLAKVSQRFELLPFTRGGGGDGECGEGSWGGDWKERSHKRLSLLGIGKDA